MPNKEKKWKTQLTLLALLTIALAVAQLITIKHLGHQLTSPIKLEYADLAISLPEGPNWKTQKEWKYQNNGFSLQSALYRSGATTAIAKYRYILAPENISTDDFFKKQANQIAGKIDNLKEFNLDNLTIHQAHIKESNTNLEILLATAKLPNNHQLNISFNYLQGKKLKKPQEIFDGIIESIEFNYQNQFDKSTKIINALKTKGVSSAFKNNTLQSFFLVQKQNLPTGFLTEIIQHSKSKNKFTIKAAYFSYIKKPFTQQEADLLLTNDSFDEYIWNEQKSSPFGKRETQIIFHKNDTFTVKKLVLPPEQKTFQASRNSIPETFLEILLTQMLRSKFKKINIDIIESNGKITPVIIAKAKPAKDNRQKNKLKYLLEITRLDNSNIQEKIFFNNRQQISKSVISQNIKKNSQQPDKSEQTSYTLIRSTAEKLAELFPEKAELIMNNQILLQQSFSNQ